MPVELPAPFRAPLVYAVPGMESVAAKQDLTYRQVGETPLQMDIYRPLNAAPGERRPAVLFVHGDASPEILAHAKDWGAYVGWGQLAAGSGLVGITFNHRSTAGRTRMPDACSDVAAALEYVRTNADALGVDPDRLCFWVCSAGGLKLKVALQGPPAFIRCIVAYYPLLDLTGAPVAVSPEILAEYSAVNYIKPGMAPMLLARAGLDHPAFNAGIDRFVEGALAQNLPLEVINHPTGEHAFDIRNPGERSQYIISHTLAFMRHHLLG